VWWGFSSFFFFLVLRFELRAYTWARPFHQPFCIGYFFFSFIFFFLVVLGLELRAYTPWATPPAPLFLWRAFWNRVLRNYLPGLALNLNFLDLCFLSSEGYRHEPLAPS
jgi:hypothetical protein